MSIQAAVPPPAGFQGKGGGPRHQRAEKERKYGTPLPLLLPSSPLHPGFSPSATRAGSSSSLLSSYAGIFSPAAALEVPTCIGRFDAASQSVWVEEPRDMQVLFDRGFFGKGTLSRSDPNWRTRRIELSKGGSALAAEQIREKRRQERKQFKIDRAAAMLDAAKKAEAVLTSGQLPEGVELVAEGPVAVVASAAPVTAGGDVGPETEATAEVGAEDGTAEGTDVDSPARAASPAPSTATDYTALLPEGTKLTAQTFLVRPTRPDANRNRGKKNFKRRAPPPAAAGTAAGGTSAASATPAPAPARAPPAEPEPEPESDSDSDSDLVAEMEHLQLSLQDAWFLSAGLGVLKVLDPATGTFVPPRALLALFLTPVLAPSAPPSVAPRRAAALYPDDPWLVSYAAYHHYRSLGWCVRDGIKFCVDWLLYRRGPVFSHSAFSILMVPVWMEPEDKAESPHGGSDWYAERTSWKWMNTIMRVNSLVQKTVIIAYITIPSLASFPDAARLPGGGLDPRYFTMRSLMERYSVREVSLMRFGPARRRD